ncbi:putative ATP-grasp superfamily ATP-dependent carboligase [Paraburkholderia sp. CI2]|uniref:ATP-grasp domain-containing protein n=1 Tax=Paraburkholderia sp. CI2 TaxID=2723093 RepID=UPI00160CE38D|nr:ATP-grasp domain-containing protein [Paraburkholderia sp. CI2]MBB5465297.1 putative ATP-grasp superfamily ATP-dependent carboligase [Paraburkholderia sp. CI2]
MKSHRPLMHAPLVAVVGQSARLLAQSAARAGLHVAALDIFGDRDTREAAELWFDIGGGDGALGIDRARLVDALARVARLPGLLGWIGGSGLEPLMPQLCRESGLPRFLGNAAEAIAAVREPRRFFALLDALRIAHPAVSFERPATAEGWLFKQADGCGGTHIEAADSFHLTTDSAHGYFQRVGQGRSLSALFIGAHGSAHLIGFAEQFTCAIGDLRFVHAGSIGPIDLPPAFIARVQQALDALCANTGLVGINSCDFLSDGTSFEVLEINPRPSSTMALYETASPDAWPAGLLACHLDACRHGRAPSAASLALARAPRRRAGQRVLYAQRPFSVSAAFSDACLRDPQCRDVPMPGTRIDAGQPVCTLHVRAASVDAVLTALDAQHERVVQRIETCDEPDHACLHAHS